MPLRTCAGCRRVRDKKELVRLTAKGAVLAPDKTGPGRGVYLCPDKECVKAAYLKKEAFSRALKTKTELPGLEALLTQVAGR